MIKIYYLIIVFFLVTFGFSQDVALYTQVNGNYDFTFVGNTMNTAENNTSSTLVTQTNSSAELSLNTDDTIVKAFLYWAGSGDGDFEVNLNGITIRPTRTFSHSRIFGTTRFTYFSAFKDITTLVQNTGNGTYTLSDLDISPFEALHFSRKTNFAGWAILIVYENSSLPINQINIYDGLQAVPSSLDIKLTNLNVFDNANASVGFIAWEGDLQLPTETFSINNIPLSNSLNPVNNVFNSTNSVTNATDLYNMDLDIYNIEDYINIGDTEASISLTSFGDVILMNTVVTKLNSQLPDASIVLNDYTTSCNAQAVTINYTVQNTNSTDVLPANTTINFYYNTTLLGTTQTQNDININDTESGTITLMLPDTASQNITITAIIDEDNTVVELNETNNTATLSVTQWLSPSFAHLEDITSCNLGNNLAVFNFSDYATEVLTSTTHSVAFFETYSDALSNTNAIINTSYYQANANVTEIFVRIENEWGCFSITSFNLNIEKCPPVIYNFVSDNNDGNNDIFFIDGIKNIFLDYELKIYNRWGRLIWEGNHTTSFWNGTVKNGINSDKAPAGTYFYILYLNDKSYPTPLTGYLLLVR